MNRFRKKPVVIEAIKLPELFDIGGRVAFEDWIGPGHKWSGDGFVIHTLEGDMRADPGDWVIKGVQGEFYPCKPAIFEATYAEAGSPPTTPDNLRWAHMIDPTIARDQVRVQTAEGEYGRLLAQTSEIKLKRALRTADLLIADLEIQS